MGVTIKDIAKHAGVSYSTVSKALRNSPLVKKPTKTKIIQIAEELGYQPNIAARSLVQKKSFTVGVVWPTVERIAPSLLITNINDRLEQHSYTTLLSINKIESAIATFTRFQVDAILIFGENEAELYDSKHFHSSVPILYYGIKDTVIKPTIDVNRRQAMQLAVEHLTKIGHMKIAFIGNTSATDPLQKEKLLGFQEAMHAFHPASQSNLIISTNGLEVYDGYLAAKSFFSDVKGTTAIVSGSYDLTRGILRAANELAINIPEDMSIVSYDNIQEFKHLEVKLTTVGVPIDRIANSITEALLSIIDGKNIPSIILEPEINSKDSCAPL